MSMLPIPGDFRPVYLCPACGKAHLSEAEARACFAADEPLPRCNVGDILIWKGGYNWHDGLDDWVILQPGKRPEERCERSFWVVVTAITRYRPPHPYIGDLNSHRWATHVQTLGLKNGRDDGFCGYTTSRHVPLFASTSMRLKPPEIVVKQAEGMVGRTFTHLL